MAYGIWYHMVEMSTRKTSHSKIGSKNWEKAKAYSFITNCFHGNYLARTTLIPSECGTLMN
jgi:hypothetical protein